MARLLALGLLGLLAAGCAHSQPRAGDEEEGLAGFYGPEFEGKRTASGATFHHEALTCAHRTLPFGSIVEVERLDADARVRVTVTDRGPFVKGRVIDLTRRAAQQLGILKKGLAPVRLHVVRVGRAR